VGPLSWRVTGRDGSRSCATGALGGWAPHLVRGGWGPCRGESPVATEVARARRERWADGRPTSFEAGGAPVVARPRSRRKSLARAGGGGRMGAPPRSRRVGPLSWRVTGRDGSRSCATGALGGWAPHLVRGGRGARGVGSRSPMERAAG